MRLMLRNAIELLVTYQYVSAYGIDSAVKYEKLRRRRTCIYSGGHETPCQYIANRKDDIDFCYCYNDLKTTTTWLITKLKNSSYTYHKIDEYSDEIEGVNDIYGIEYIDGIRLCDHKKPSDNIIRELENVQSISASQHMERLVRLCDIMRSMATYGAASKGVLQAVNVAHDILTSNRTIEHTPRLPEFPYSAMRSDTLRYWASLVKIDVFIGPGGWLDGHVRNDYGAAMSQLVAMWHETFSNCIPWITECDCSNSV